MRYFLHVRHRGRLIPDLEGDELPNEDALRELVLANVRHLVFRGHMRSIRSWFDCTYEVTDETHRTVLVVPFDTVVPVPHWALETDTCPSS